MDAESWMEDVPPAVARNLARARCALATQAWRHLPLLDRVVLAHLPAESARELAVWTDVLHDVAARAGVTVHPLAAAIRAEPPAGEPGARAGEP